MNVPLWVWALTLTGLIALIVADLLLMDRGEPREFTPHRAAGWSVFYIMLAVLFGLGVLVFGDGVASAQFFAGYLTEKSLSVDNLFIFYVIMTRFAVPSTSQHRVLMFGIVISLVLRGLFIAAGAAAIAAFHWLFSFSARSSSGPRSDWHAAMTTRSSRRTRCCAGASGFCRPPPATKDHGCPSAGTASACSPRCSSS
jgi:Membrane protein TerC, possibly involved in tellurium resistance